jgi:hypothetical protein
MLTSGATTLRRAYDYVALFALLHVAALVALVSYLVMSGTLTADTAREIVLLMKGHKSEAEPPDTPPAAHAAPAPEAQPDSAKKSFSEMQTDLEIVRLEAERIKTELDQRLALNNSIMLRVTTAREAFEREQATAMTAQRASVAERDREGFKKQLAIFENLAPKVALDHLLKMDDVGEAARLLLEMDTRKAKKIVEAAKRGEEMDAMRTILRRVREVAPLKIQEMSEEP